MHGKGMPCVNMHATFEAYIYGAPIQFVDKQGGKEEEEGKRGREERRREREERRREREEKKRKGKKNRGEEK